MSNKDILEKAIQKAIAGGWDVEFAPGRLWLKIHDRSGDLASLYHRDTWATPSLIYNHDFAKALWKNAGDYSFGYRELGDGGKRYGWRSLKVINPKFVNLYGLRGWEFHLQQMVIADDPIKYLGDHL